MIAIDTETFLISPSEPIPQVVCVTVSDGERMDIIHAKDERCEPLVKRLLDEHVCVFHNAAFDLAVLLRSFRAIRDSIFAALAAGRVRDTMIRQLLIDVARDNSGRETVAFRSLAALVDSYLGEKVEGKQGDDIWRLRYHELFGIPLEEWPEAALSYAKKDPWYTMRVYRAMPGGDGDKPYPGEVLLNESQFHLHLAGTIGMLADGERAKRTREDIERRMEELRGPLYEAGLLVDGKVSAAAAKRRAIKIAAEKGIKLRATKSGDAAADALSAELLDDDLLRMRCEYVSLRKLLSTYLSVVEEAAASRRAISTRYTVARSGRTASSAPRGMLGWNAQNLPRTPGIRECIVPRPGNVFVAGDFSGAELRTIAQVQKSLYGTSALGDALQSGKDIHSWFAARLLGVDYDEFVARLEAGNPEAKRARQNAKAANFGFPGGMGPAKFCDVQLLQAGVRWTEQDARKLRDAWLAAFPEMRRYLRDGRAACAAGDATVRIFGSGRVIAVNRPNAWCNFQFQGLAADAGRTAFSLVSRECYVGNSVLRGCFPVAFIHDEIIIEAPEDEHLDARVARFVEVMESAWSSVVPDLPTTVDTVVMRRWSKQAKLLRDAAGRIIPWDEEV